MHRLKAITPLGGTSPQIDRFDGLVISENVDRALASVAARQGQDVACSAAVLDQLRLPLPKPGKWSVEAAYMAWWMGPDLWMVDADHTDHELLAVNVKRAVGGTGSVAEQTDGWCRFDVSGVRVLDVLERLCNLNLRAGEAGDAHRAVIEHLGCFVLCLETGRKYAVIGPRSSAGSLHHALLTTAQSVI
ncbi:MAG: sarcosine oxidase, gamma subunit [Rhodobacteraceae bacterium]|nr:MAG: sarcosine oxidase, gamma subunit [Paracoccaceae bacterium]